MNFKRIITARPGSDLKTYKAYRAKKIKDSTGYSHTGYDFNKPFCIFDGVISKAKQTEKRVAEQMSHHVTHEVIVYHRVPIEADDVLLLGNRQFVVHEIRDPGEIGLFFCIMCEERKGNGLENGSH